ncbi:DUF6234 family protein [Micromonospora sp. R77]|uniref:DUF6234 family protein n=1 Tax=Micromonospora sp. R77 TaxID=2925836 RepID=UPI001F626268|nr:DUF6234 family protein [Micromonospora sp. R77]MCI4062599.1 DUF6234 family protein [Micromonospora sp. R77]
MTTATTASTGRRGGPVVGILVLLWVCALLALAWWVFSIGMQQWAANYSDGPADLDGLKRQANLAMLIITVVAAGGPVMIAFVAYRLRLTRTAIVFAVLAALLAIPAMFLAASAYQSLNPAPAPAQPGPPGHCVELSGDDNRCPGG